MQTFIDVWYNTCNFPFLTSSVLTWILAAILFTSFGARSHVCGWVVFLCSLSRKVSDSLDLYVVSYVTSGVWREGHPSIEPSIEAFVWGGKLIPASETLFQIKIRKMDNVQKIYHCIHSRLPVCSIVFFFSRMFLSRIGIAWWTSFASPDCRPPIMNWRSKVCVTRSVWWNRQSDECGHVNSCGHYLPN
jgi:hypothetical protein